MLQIIALLAGVWIIFYINQAYKTYGYSFIRRLVWVSLLLNLWLLLGLTSKYINLNVTYFHSSTKISWGYLIRHPLSSLIYSGAVLVFLSVVMELSMYRIFAHMADILKRIFALIVISYIAGFILYAYNPDAGWLEYIDVVLITSGNALVYISLILLILINRQKEKKKPAVRMFVITYGLVFLPIAAFMFMFPFKFTVLSVLFILANFIPVIWIKWFFVKYYVDHVKFENGNESLDYIVEKYGLTKREREIMELILRGKSNKEIKSALYISLNTVRNHTHNLYKKLKVNGRGQMAGLIFNSTSSTQ